MKEKVKKNLGNIYDKLRKNLRISQDFSKIGPLLFSLFPILTLNDLEQILIIVRIRLCVCEYLDITSHG